MTREREDFFAEYRQGAGGRGGGAGGPGGGGGRGFGGGGMGGGAGGRGGSFSRQAQVKALKESVQTGHRTGLPRSLLELFAARPPLQESTEASTKTVRPKPTLAGVAHLVEKFADPGDPEYEPKVEDRPPEPRLCRNRELPFQARIDTETKTEKKLRLIQWKKEEAQRIVAENIKAWDPNKDTKIQGDPYKTLFVSRLSYDVTEKKLRRDFEEFGPIRSMRIVYDKDGKHRGYAFIEYEHKKDMKEAYKQADGRKIEGRRVVVDVERGRTVENWRPRRLAGGLGGQGREPKPPKKGGAAALPVIPAPAVEDDRRREDFRPPPREEPRPRERSPRRERPKSPERKPDDRRSGADRDRPRTDDRERKRERSRERERSPRRERDDRDKRRHVEDGEVRGDSGRKRERDVV